MGRYYSGDINGKFWFGVQSSDAADRFGVIGRSDFLHYYFTDHDLPQVENEIKAIKKTLTSKKISIIKKVILKSNGYSDKDLVDNNITQEELSEYADLELGIKIRKCIKKEGHCEFDAEL